MPLFNELVTAVSEIVGKSAFSLKNLSEPIAEENGAILEKLSISELWMAERKHRFSG